MRLSADQIATIRRAVAELVGPGAEIILFGSRVDDQARGGDIDLLIEVPHPVEQPAWLCAQLSGRISHRLEGRKVDVVVSAPNLERLPIQDVARREGVPL